MNNPNIKRVLVQIELDSVLRYHWINLPEELPYQKTKAETRIADDGTLVVRLLKDQ